MGDTARGNAVHLGSSGMRPDNRQLSLKLYVSFCFIS